MRAFLLLMWSQKLLTNHILVRTIRGPWFSVGLHVDYTHRHIDIHFWWWVIVIGNTVEPLYCGHCGAKVDDQTETCPGCEIDFTYSRPGA